MPFIPENESDVFDDRLKGLTTRCPDCERVIPSTGRMVYNALLSIWYPEYYCAFDNQKVLKRSNEIGPLLDEIAHDNGY
ncbi:MAG: hypothetical protein JNL34_06550 [Anaerolineae bacterium]|nr:hypothetical protein [Anaerolineae bacterium]